MAKTVVHYHFCDGTNTGTPPNVITLETILQHIVVLGEKMSALSEKVDQILAMESEEDALAAAQAEIIADLRQQISDLTTQLTESLGNDAVMQEEIDRKTAELEAQAADVQANLDRLEEAFPTPVALPPEENQNPENPENPNPENP